MDKIPGKCTWSKLFAYVYFCLIHFFCLIFVLWTNSVSLFDKFLLSTSILVWSTFLYILSFGLLVNLMPAFRIHNVFTVVYLGSFAFCFAHKHEKHNYWGNHKYWNLCIVQCKESSWDAHVKVLLKGLLLWDNYIEYN